MRYLLFGASSTHGVGDPEFGGWAGRLRNFLDMKEGTNNFINLSISGNTTDDILERFEDEARRRIGSTKKEDMSVILSLGTNDARLIDDEKPDVPLDRFEDNVRKLIYQAKELAGNVFVIGPSSLIEKYTQPFKNYYWYNDRIKKYSDVLEKVCNEEEISFLNLYTEDPDENLYDDGLHPNAEGHRILYEKIKDFLMPHLE